MYPRALSKCPCIHVHVAGYSYACCHLSQRVWKDSISTWSCIYVQNLILHCGPEQRIWSFAMDNRAEFGYMLWATVQSH